MIIINIIISLMIIITIFIVIINIVITGVSLSKILSIITLTFKKLFTNLTQKVVSTSKTEMKSKYETELKITMHPN